MFEVVLREKDDGKRFILHNTSSRSEAFDEAIRRAPGFPKDTVMVQDVRRGVVRSAWIVSPFGTVTSPVNGHLLARLQKERITTRLVPKI